MKKNYFSKLQLYGRIISIVLIFVMSMEISARVDDKIKYGAPFFKPYNGDRLTTFDQEGIKCNIPNSRYEKWKINNFGFRGPDLSLEKPENTTRIFCIGASETFGLYESSGKEWPSQLMKSLENKGRFQVINASVVGLPLKNFTKYVKKYVLKLEPDVLILFVNPFGYAADIDNFLKRQNPNNLAKDKSKERKEKAYIKFRHFLFHLRIYKKIKQAIRDIIPEESLIWYRIRNLKRQLNKLEAKNLNGNQPLDVAPDEGLQSLKNDLELVLTYFKNLKVKIILSSYPVLITPENMMEYKELFLDHRRFYIELSLLGIIDAARKSNEMYMKVAKEFQIPFIDIDSKMPKNTDYFADNVHYTDKGAKLIAENIAGFISNRKILTDCTRNNIPNDASLVNLMYRDY